MLSGRVKLQLAAFFLLSVGVAGNVFLLQPKGRGARTGDGQAVASAAPLEFGDTGSIARDDAAPSSGLTFEPLPPVDIPRTGSDLTRAVQRELQVRGYETGGADGIVGLMTRAAIMGFEHDHGMVMTGRPSQELLKRIVLGGGATDKPIGSKGQSAEARDVVRSVQASLAKLGYRPGSLDGELSPETMRAIREFEVDHALPQSGRISGPLVVRLARLDSDRVASGP